MATRRWSSKRMRIRSGLFCGSIYWVLLVSGRVSVPKPLSQIQRSTRWLLQGLSPRTSFGGFGLKELHRESLARCKQSLTILGVPDDIADEIALDPSVGYELILPTAGSQLVVGGQGVGKTLAVERLFQNAIGDALGDSSKPSPIFVRAMDLNGTLRDYVENVTRGYAFPTAQGALVVINGLDEVGTANANRLLSDVLPYVEANPNITVVVTTRPLLGLTYSGLRINVPALDEQGVLQLISKVAGRTVELRELRGWVCRGAAPIVCGSALLRALSRWCLSSLRFPYIGTSQRKVRS